MIEKWNCLAFADPPGGWRGFTHGFVFFGLIRSLGIEKWHQTPNSWHLCIKTSTNDGPHTLPSQP
jgi:hypothetical protein